MERNTRYLDFFLGALSPAGFHGYFAQLTAQPGLTPFLIKAGPGCGKSTMMKKLADLGSGTVERIHCSSDPASLDGAVFWEQNTAILDATAPHTLEPACPVAVEQVVSLYHTLDRTRMQANAEAVRALFGRCSCLQGRAARYLAAAGALLLENRRLAAGVTDESKARRYAARLAERRMPRREGPEYLLVDGYNVIFAWDELKEMAAKNLEAARNMLMDILCNYQGFKKCVVILVFDAYKVKGNPGSVERYKNIHVVYTKEAETADTYIERATYEIAKDHSVRVATSDNLEQLIILGHGAVRVAAADLRTEVEAAEGRITEIIDRSNRAHKGFNTLRDRATVTGGPDQPPKQNRPKK